MAAEYAMPIVRQTRLIWSMKRRGTGPHGRRVEVDATVFNA